jgi:mRNA interferase MazF
VLLVLFPDSNLQTAKRRPVVVVQAEQLGTNLPQVVVAMITSNLQRDGHPSRVLVERGSSSGRRSELLSDSVVMTDNLATIAYTEIDRIIGELPTDAIDVALRHTLGL